MYIQKLVNKCASTHLNANVSLESNANVKFDFPINVNVNVLGSYSNTNAIELISNVLALY